MSSVAERFGKVVEQEGNREFTPERMLGLLKNLVVEQLPQITAQKTASEAESAEEIGIKSTIPERDMDALRKALGEVSPNRPQVSLNLAVDVGVAIDAYALASNDVRTTTLAEQQNYLNKKAGLSLDYLNLLTDDQLRTASAKHVGEVYKNWNREKERVVATVRKYDSQLQALSAQVLSLRHTPDMDRNTEFVYFGSSVMSVDTDRLAVLTAQVNALRTPEQAAPVAAELPVEVVPVTAAPVVELVTEEPAPVVAPPEPEITTTPEADAVEEVVRPAETTDTDTTQQDAAAEQDTITPVLWPGRVKREQVVTPPVDDRVVEQPVAQIVPPELLQKKNAAVGAFNRAKTIFDVFESCDTLVKLNVPVVDGAISKQVYLAELGDSIDKIIYAIGGKGGWLEVFNALDSGKIGSITIPEFLVKKINDLITTYYRNEKSLILVMADQTNTMTLNDALKHLRTFQAQKMPDTYFNLPTGAAPEVPRGRYRFMIGTVVEQLSSGVSNNADVSVAFTVIPRLEQLFIDDYHARNAANKLRQAQPAEQQSAPAKPGLWQRWFG